MDDYKETNSCEYTNNSPVKNGENKEITLYSQSEIREFPDNSSSSKKSKKSGGSMKLLPAVTAAVALFTAAVFIVPSGASAKANFMEVAATDTSVSYYIELENRDENFEYKAVVYNDFTRREQIIEGDRIGGEASDLKPNMRYNLAVECEGRQIARTNVRTYSREEMMHSEFYDVSYYVNEENNSLDFTLNFVDDFRYWTNFDATLQFGDVTLDCEFTENPYDLQTFAYTEGFPHGVMLILTVTCLSSQNKHPLKGSNSTQSLLF